MLMENAFAEGGWGRRWVVALLMAGLLGCHGGDDRTELVIARVNDNEITALQLNRLLRNATPDVSARVPTRAALDSLIDQDLLYQEALKNDLDKDPEVVEALAAARRQILADIYAERTIYPRTSVSEAEEAEYYRQHPSLFTARKIYQIETFQLEGAVPSATLRVELSRAHTAEEVARLLQQNNIAFERQSSERAAEQLPMEMLEQFARASAGDIIIVPHGDERTVLMQITQTIDKPLTLEQARPYIHQFLVSDRNRAAMQARMKELRAKSRVEYLGGFATNADEEDSGDSMDGKATSSAR